MVVLVRSGICMGELIKERKVLENEHKKTKREKRKKENDSRNV